MDSGLNITVADKCWEPFKGRIRADKVISCNFANNTNSWLSNENLTDCVPPPGVLFFCETYTTTLYYFEILIPVKPHLQIVLLKLDNKRCGSHFCVEIQGYVLGHRFG